MRMTVVGVLIIVGAIVATVLIAEHIAQNLNRKRGTDSDQPNPNS